MVTPLEGQAACHTFTRPFCVAALLGFENETNLCPDT